MVPAKDWRPFQVPVLPMGNLLPADMPAYRRKRMRGLGHLAILSDALIVRILDTLITEHAARIALHALTQFSATSSISHAFAADDDLWRRLAFTLFSPARLARAPFAISWRATVLRLLTPSTSPPQRLTASASPACTPVYSDILFHKRRCRNAPIDPDWLVHDDIPRVSVASHSPQNFRERFETRRRPIILTDAMTDWPASRTWSPSHLSASLPDVEFNAGGYSFTLGDYFNYCNAVENADDQALYIFDSNFAEKAPALASDYSLPDVFSEDLFSVLGSRRPHFRWLIIGPPRSGSSFHIDPNATSAWNAAIRGRKKWLFFPPDVTPPGISPSVDGADVTAPVSVMEWFVNFYNRDLIEQVGAVEAVVQPGEIMFVPRGWWHCVLNLDVSIAVTQNFVSSCNVQAVVRWLRNCPEQVSGCKSKADAAYLSANFASLVVQDFPHLRDSLSFALPNGEDEELANTNATPVVGNKRKSLGLWQSLQSTSTKAKSVSEVNPNVESFSFGF